MRNQRLFGSLMGTLAKFQGDEKGREDKEAKRAAALKRAEERSGEESRRLMALEREGQGERRRAVTQQSAELAERVERKRKQLAHARWCERKEREASFLLTSAMPALSWRPARLCEVTRAALAVRQEECTAAIQEASARLEEELGGERPAEDAPMADAAPEPAAEPEAVPADEGAAGDVEEGEWTAAAPPAVVPEEEEDMDADIELNRGGALAAILDAS